MLFQVVRSLRTLEDEEAELISRLRVAQEMQREAYGDLESALQA